MRLNSINQIQSEILILEGSLSATMSQKTACAIDGAIGKIGAGGKMDMSKCLHSETSKFRVPN